MLRYLLATSILFVVSQPLPAQVIINEIADPENDSDARFVELYNPGPASVDLTGYVLRRYTDDNLNSGDVNLTANTILNPGDYYVIANQRIPFAARYSTYPPPDDAAFAVNTNGDDSYELFDGSTVVDAYGVPGTDGTGEDWEYEDSIVDRVDQTQNLGVFSVSQFSILTPGTTADASPGRAPTRPLPVTLADFRAAVIGAADVSLSWATHTETDNAYFDVERSSDGERFSTVGQVSGAGSSSERREYNYLYRARERGAVYFRLTQVDLDGARTSSEVIGVNLAEGDAPLTATPSSILAGGRLQVWSPGLRPLRVIDMQGAVLTTLARRAGSQSLDVGGLAAGMYVLTDGASSVRFVRL